MPDSKSIVHLSRTPAALVKLWLLTGPAVCPLPSQYNHSMPTSTPPWDAVPLTMAVPRLEYTKTLPATLLWSVCRKPAMPILRTHCLSLKNDKKPGVMLGGSGIGGGGVSRRTLSDETTLTFYDLELNLFRVTLIWFLWTTGDHFILLAFVFIYIGLYFFFFSYSYFVSDKVFSKHLLISQTFRFKNFTALTSAVYLYCRWADDTCNSLYTYYTDIEL